jgi:hypothetical protein
MNAALIVSAIIMLAIEVSGAAASSDTKILQQQNHSFIALLTGNNVIPPVSTNTTGIVKISG